MTKATIAQNARARRKAYEGRLYDESRIWWLSYGQRIRGRMASVRNAFVAEAEAAGVSQAQYLLAILEGLGPEGRHSAFRDGQVIEAERVIAEARG